MILIIDDDETSRNSVEDILKEAGHVTHSCHDGLLAFKYYASLADQINIIIIDLVMVRLNGVRCIPLLKEIKPKTKVIITSTHNEECSEDVKRFVEQDFPFLKKPISPSELKKLVNSILKN